MPPVDQKNKLPSGAVETPAETLARSKAMLEPKVSANDLVNPPAKVNPPVPQVPTNDGSTTANLVSNVTDNTQNYITAQSAEAAKARELAGLLGNQTFDGQGQRTALGEQYGLPQNLARLTDIQTQLAKANTASDVQKVRIASAAGQTLGQGQRELTQQDRENAVRTAGLAAEAAVLQGNIETASTLVNQAMSDYYNDRQLQNQNMIQQLDYYSGIADKQTAQLLEQEKRKYEADQKQVQRVLDTVDAAMASGAATAEDMRILTNPKATDEERLAVAQGVVARGAGQMRDLDIQAQQASIANSYSAISDRNRRFDLDLMKFEQSTIDAVREEQKKAATEAEAQAIENKAKGDKALSMLASINELSTHPGFNASVGPNPLARTNYGLLTGFWKESFTGDKSSFKSEVERLANTLTLENMDLLKGPATDKDVEIVAASMSRLKNMDVTEESYAQELGRLQQAAQRIVDEVGATPEQLQYYGLADEATISEADAVWGTPSTYASPIQIGASVSF